jgi:hypothetical protein
VDAHAICPMGSARGQGLSKQQHKPIRRVVMPGIVFSISSKEIPPMPAHRQR